MTKRTLGAILVVIMTLILTSCVKQSEFSKADKNYVFTIEDISGLDLSDYKIKPRENETRFFFTKSENKLNGTNVMYSITLINDLDEEIALRTSINLQSSEDRAIQLFESQGKTPNNLLNLVPIDRKPEEYGTDEIKLLKSDTMMWITLRKDHLVYDVQITGIALEEDQIKKSIVEKFSYILENKGIE